MARLWIAHKDTLRRRHVQASVMESKSLDPPAHADRTFMLGSRRQHLNSGHSREPRKPQATFRIECKRDNSAADWTKSSVVNLPRTHPTTLTFHNHHTPSSSTDPHTPS